MAESSGSNLRFGFPFGVVGAIVGALFIDSWTGQSDWGLIEEILAKVGLCALAGEFTGWVIRKSPTNREPIRADDEERFRSCALVVATVIVAAALLISGIFALAGYRAGRLP